MRSGSKEIMWKTLCTTNIKRHFTFPKIVNTATLTVEKAVSAVTS